MRILLISCAILLPGLFFCQEKKNTAPGYFVIKPGGALWYDDDQSLLDKAGTPRATSRSDIGKDYVTLDQIWVGQTAAVIEFNYFHPRTDYFGTVIGCAYTINETFYGYKSYTQILQSNSQYLKEYGSGSCALQNHRFKFILGYNINTRIGFRFYFQPLNPELRFISGKSKISVDSYEGYKYKKPVLSVQYGGDSTSTFMGTETRNVSYHGPALTICFPTTLGFEQDFKIKKHLFVIGLSGSFSAIERYLSGRLYLGIRFQKPERQIDSEPQK